MHGVIQSLSLIPIIAHFTRFWFHLKEEMLKVLFLPMDEKHVHEMFGTVIRF